MSYMRTRRAALRYNSLLNKLSSLEDNMDACEHRCRLIESMTVHCNRGLLPSEKKEIDKCKKKYASARNRHIKVLAETKKMEAQYGFNYSVF